MAPCATFTRQKRLFLSGIMLSLAEHHVLFYYSSIRRDMARRGDASDADRTIVQQQLAHDTGLVSWSLIDARDSRWSRLKQKNCWRRANEIVAMDQ